MEFFIKLQIILTVNSMIPIVESSTNYGVIFYFQKERLNIYQRIEHFFRGTQDSVGLRCIPSILNIDDKDELLKEIQKSGNIKNLLIEKNIENYTIGNDIMHILSGHIKNLYEAISSEEGFIKNESENTINHILSRLSSKSRW